MEHFSRVQGPYLLTSDPELAKLDAIHAALTQAYWSEGIPLETVRKALEHSLNFSLLKGDEQVGFARVVTDRATFAYLCDVYIVESQRGQGLGKWMIEGVMAHPDLQSLRRFMLMTRDAHSLYARFGFVGPRQPERVMEITWPARYKSAEPGR